MDRIARQFVRVGDCSGSPFADCFDAGTLGVSGGEILCFNCLHVVYVVRGSNQPEGDQNGRATMGTGPVGFDYASLGAASGRCGFPHGITGELLECVGGEPFVFKGLGGCDSVGVVGCGFHSLYGHQLPAEPTLSHRLAGKFKLR